MKAESHWGYVLITGASSGIGLEISKLFAKDKHHLVLVAREPKKLEEKAKEIRDAYGVDVKTVAVDLGETTSPTQLADNLKKQNLPIQVLVNNAGFGDFGPFAEASLEKTMNMIQVNIVTLTELTRLLLPEMVKHGSGRIVNLASTAAFQPGPLMAVYYATKSYVLSFSEAIGNELEGSGVTVTAICPGPTISGFQKTAEMEKSKLVKGSLMDSETVAKIAYAGILRGKRIVITGLLNKVMAQSVRFTPRSVITKIVRKMQEAQN